MRRAVKATRRDADIDPSTPVIIGAGQVCERVDDESYRGLSAVELAAQAAARSVEDAGAQRDRIVAAIDTVAGIRQFEISVPGALAPLGRSDNYPRSVADRIGAQPKTAILEVSGGQSPQHLLTELARDIATGTLRTALLVGSEAISTARRFATADDRPDFSELRGGQLEDRGYGLKGLISRVTVTHGLTDAPSQYALLENARRAKLGLTQEAYAKSMGQLFAPFSRIAAKNPYSAAPREYSAAELVEVTARNRIIADPYRRLLVARDQVNQAAAILIASVAAARQLGVPQSNWIYLHGHADLREAHLLKRPDLASSPAAIRAVNHALAVAGIGMDDVSLIDLYSCFPIAVFNICDGLGLSPNDPRGLTVTGGLPYFGDAGNNYSMHAIAEVVARLRDAPGAYALVGANGGILSKYSVGVYNTRPTNWRENQSAAVQAELDAVPTIAYTIHADGSASIETYTVKRGRDGELGIVVGRLSDGTRFLANTSPADAEMMQLLSSDEPIGKTVYARSFGRRNLVCLNKDRMQRLLPRPALAIKSQYRFALVDRRNHVLEVTINRPAARNCLTPDANQELEEIFDGFFADPELWVAIIAGAGSEAFCGGVDLRYIASGKPVWLPKTGFAGLTSRRDMTKPVIAAVNGYALGGGFEIALACHALVADINAQFALREVQVGLVAGAGGLVRLPRTVPRHIAHELILTGRRMSTEEAQRYGLVNRVAEAGQAVGTARKLAAEMVAASPTSTRISLQIMDESASIADSVSAVDHCVELIDELFVTEDMVEGVTAFADKRRPVWRNR